MTDPKTVNTSAHANSSFDALQQLQSSSSLPSNFLNLPGISALLGSNTNINETNSKNVSAAGTDSIKIVPPTASTSTSTSTAITTSEAPLPQVPLQPQPQSQQPQLPLQMQGASTTLNPLANPSFPPYLKPSHRCMFTAQANPMLKECFAKVTELCKELKDIDLRVVNHSKVFFEEEKAFQKKAQKILADKHSTEKDIQEILQHEHNDNPNKTAIDDLRSLSIKKATQAYEMIEEMITKFDLSKEELLKQMDLNQNTDQDLISMTNYLNTSLFNSSMQSLPDDMNKNLGINKMGHGSGAEAGSKLIGDKGGYIGDSKDRSQSFSQSGGLHQNSLNSTTNIHTDSLQQLNSNENQISASTSKKGDHRGSSINQKTKGVDQNDGVNQGLDSSMYLLGKQSSNASTATATTTVDPNEPTYCYCGRHYYGTMIGCDGEDECDNEWFHQDCVGLSHLDLENEPLDSWYCEECYERGLAPPDYVKPKVIITNLTAPCLVAKYGSN